MIRKGVDVIIDMVHPASHLDPRIQGLGPEARNDLINGVYDHILEDDTEDTIKKELKAKESMKSGLTTIIGSVMQKQQCWERSSCIFGDSVKDFPAKDVTFM